MSSNPHNLILSSEYSRLYENIPKKKITINDSISKTTLDSNISIRSKYNTNTPYLTRENLGFGFSPKKEQRKKSKSKSKSKSSTSSDDDDSSSSDSESSSSSRRSRSSSKSSEKRHKHRHKHKHRHHPKHHHHHHHHKDKDKDKKDKDKEKNKNGKIDLKEKNKDKKDEENSIFKFKKKTNEQWFKEKLKNSTNNNTNNNNGKDFLNKKRSFLSWKEKEEKMELEASAKIDRMLEEIRREKRVNQMIAERKKQLENKIKEKEKEEMKAKIKKKKIVKKQKSSNFFLEVMGITEEEIVKNIKEKEAKEAKEKEKENDLIFNNKNSITNGMGFSNIDINLLFAKHENKPKYYNFKVSNDDIYKKVLSFEFYNEKLKTENIPDFFDNELHYRYIWITDFYNELKYCLLNEKAEKSDCQNYMDADIKIQLHYLSHESNNDIACFSIMVNRNLMELKKKILKDKDILAVYPENEKINNDDINISNKNNLRYFLAVVKREIDSYETKLLVHANDLKKFELNDDKNLEQNSKNNNNIKFYKVKYLNNINSSIREFNALLSLELSSFKDILNPKKLLSNNNTKPGNNESTNNNALLNRGDTFINSIKYSNLFNPSQIEVLSKANNLKKNELLLIQGPPGTGKTHTILGLISLFMLNSHTRILICTQSNTAIDEICFRLLTKGLYDERLNNIKSNFIRFGYTDRKDKEKKYLDTKRGKMLEKYSLEYLTDAKFKEKLENSYLEREQIIKETNFLSKDKIKNAEKLKLLESKRQTLMKALSKNKYEKQNYEYYLLSNSPILCTTLNNAGNERLKKTKLNYDYLIIDEACQCVEPSSLIPLCHGIKNLILVGDHKQLPATVFYPKAKNILYNRSLFERLIDNNIPRHILTIQYRMQTNIRQLISQLFYENKLQDSPDEKYIEKMNKNIIYKIINIKNNFSFFDINFSEEIMDNNMKSYYNWTEIDFVFLLLKRINYKLKNIFKEKEYKYAIITPYQAQVKKFKDEKYKYSDFSNIDIAINTVDSFQGQERDIVLFSTVRSNNKNNNGINNDVIGFLSDFRRMNVAISRAKFGCFIVGNSNKFKSDPYWEKLINFCKDKNCFFNVKDKHDFNYIVENIFVKENDKY